MAVGHCTVSGQKHG